MVGHQPLQNRVTRERRAAGEEEVEGAAQAVDIGAVVDPLGSSACSGAMKSTVPM